MSSSRSWARRLNGHCLNWRQDYIQQELWVALSNIDRWTPRSFHLFNLILLILYISSVIVKIAKFAFRFLKFSNSDFSLNKSELPLFVLWMYEKIRSFSQSLWPQGFFRLLTLVAHDALMWNWLVSGFVIRQARVYILLYT